MGKHFFVHNVCYLTEISKLPSEHFLDDIFQKAATDALQSMTVVLKKESSAGTSYEALFDGARSLATGLGSMLRVSSYGARSYDTKDNNGDLSNVFRRRRSFGEWILSLVGLEARQRPKRDTIEDQLQARNEVR